MQIVETANEGLKRSYTITIAAVDIAARVEGEIKKIAPQVRMPGFRPGKVPANLVRKMHGPALHQEALNTTIREAMDKLVRDHSLRPAMQPQIALGEGYDEGKDAELTVSLEVLPEIAAPSLDGLKLEKLVVPVVDAEVDEAVARIGQGSKSFKDAKKGAKAKEGDQLIIDFTGKLDGVEFEGGKAEDAALEIGSGRFIPGFEESYLPGRNWAVAGPDWRERSREIQPVSGFGRVHSRTFSWADARYRHGLRTGYPKTLPWTICRARRPCVAKSGQPAFRDALHSL